MCDALRCAVMRCEARREDEDWEEEKESRVEEVWGGRGPSGNQALEREREQKTQLLVLFFLFWDPGAGRRVLSVSRQSVGDEIKIRPSDTMALNELGI